MNNVFLLHVSKGVEYFSEEETAGILAQGATGLTEIPEQTIINVL